MSDNVVDSLKPGKLPEGYTWLNAPSEWRVTDDGLVMKPQALTDLFSSPDGGVTSDNACLLYTSVSDDFTAVARVRGKLVGFGDAAAVTFHATSEVWGKLCMERSPHGDISVVSVVTRGVSDDCNGEVLESPECWLRVTRRGNVFGMHYSIDGSLWRFVRTFHLDVPPTVKVGIHAQAPFSDGCEVTFGHFSVSPEPVSDFRSGE